MTVTVERIVAARERLESHLRSVHLDDGLLVGPDPGVRFNARLYRFAKSYLRVFPWNDGLVYAQAQKYWMEAMKAAGDLHQVTMPIVRATVEACARRLAARQTPEGYWPYPNPEWSGRIATVEGNYAAIGLLVAHEVTGRSDFLEPAVRWYDYAVEHVGFQSRGETEAINYFGNRLTGRIPNNSASAIRAFGMMASVTGDDRYLEHVGPMVAFLASAQLPTGELPYAVAGDHGGDRIHFLCFQYNAFQFLNLVDYRDRTSDGAVDGVIEGVAAYLRGSLTGDGRARHDCSSTGPDVVYYAMACARALKVASRLGLVEPIAASEMAIDRVLRHQRRDGSFPYSFRNYGVLHDFRSYPRYLAMILAFLTAEIGERRG